MPSLYDKLMEKTAQQTPASKAGDKPAEQNQQSPTSVEKAEAPPIEQPKTRIVHKKERDTTTPRHRNTNHDTMIPSNHDTMTPVNEDEMLESLRKSAKQIGKEAATQRLTLEEKNALKAIEFTYGQQGIITSKNEILRIATNYILWDYKHNGEHSILAKVLKRLNS